MQDAETRTLQHAVAFEAVDSSQDAEYGVLHAADSVQHADNDDRQPANASSWTRIMTPPRVYFPHNVLRDAVQQL
jgi:hypothetical protein